jgi:hypothetical protein
MKKSNSAISKRKSKRYIKNKKRMSDKRYHNMSKPQRQEEDLRLRLMAEALLKGRMASSKD